MSSPSPEHHVQRIEHLMPNEASVVLVEDDPNISDLVDMYLRQDGFRVYQATTGERGLEQVRDRAPRLVILDIGLAGEMDGMDVGAAVGTVLGPGPGRAVFSSAANCRSHSCRSWQTARDTATNS